MTAKSITLHELAEGEIYAGILIKDGVPSHHVILLPGDAESVTWAAAVEWAESIGGELVHAVGSGDLHKQEDLISQAKVAA